MEILAHRNKQSFILCLILKVAMFKVTSKKRKMYCTFCGGFLLWVFFPQFDDSYTRSIRYQDLFLSWTIYEHEHLRRLRYCAVEG